MLHPHLTDAILKGAPLHPQGVEMRLYAVSPEKRPAWSTYLPWKSPIETVPPAALPAASSWARNWNLGREMETKVESYLKGRGASVLNVGKSSKVEDAKGPRISSDKGEYRSPDLLAFLDGAPTWIECKWKESWSYHRMTGVFEVGFPEHVLQDYERLQGTTGIPVLLVLQVGDGPYLCCYLNDLKGRVYRGTAMPTAMRFVKKDLWLELMPEGALNTSFLG